MWKNQNLGIFQGLSWSTDEVIKNSLYWAKQYVSMSKSNGSKLSSMVFDPGYPDGWVYLNIDGSVKYEDMFAAAGGLLRDHQGTWIVGFTRYLSSCEIDNLEAVNLIHEGVRKCSNSTSVMRILLILKQLSNWNLQHILREENSVADKIIKLRKDREPGLQLFDKDY
ncbi:uncharacterized protein, partial [Gossypium hirsutum]|uniref:RNase H type-1 domain-containing protein n=1 Tax=Gossypium hirsutum TaxID=3635 RepID=A0A1U8N3L1_GOSHI